MLVHLLDNTKQNKSIQLVKTHKNNFKVNRLAVCMLVATNKLICALQGNIKDGFTLLMVIFQNFHQIRRSFCGFWLG